VQGAEVDLDQHRDDHDPDHHTHRQVDLGQLHAAHRLEQVWQHLPQADAQHDAQKHPHREVTLKHIHGCRR
jgi:hypothetical protein